MSTADATPPLIAHLERFLGPIGRGWSATPDGKRLPFTVAIFDSPPHHGPVVFGTIGLSNLAFESPSHREIRHELLFACHEEFAEANVPAVLQQLGQQVIASGVPLLRGDFVGPSGRMFPDSELTGLYAANPVFLPDELTSQSDLTARVAFAWMVPLTTSEIAWGRKQGWAVFERQLINLQPDLFDLRRKPFE